MAGPVLQPAAAPPAVDEVSAGGADAARSALPLRAAIAEPAVASASRPAEPFVLAGVVLDVRGAAVADVQVQLTPFGSQTGGPSARSDAFGAFELVLPDVCGGNLRVDDPHWTAVYPVVLWGNRDVGELTLIVAPAADVGGIVVDERGAPVAGARLQVHAPLPSRAAFARSLERNLVGEWTTISGADGRFSLARVPVLDGTTLATSCEGHADDRRTLGAERAALRIALRSTRALLTGRVVDRDGRPADGAVVWCAGRGVNTDAEGLRGLQRRAYRLRVEHRNSLRVLVTEPIDAGRHDVVIRMPGDATWGEIAGVVVDRHGRPVAGAGVWLRHESAHGALETSRIETDAEGRFRIAAGMTRAADALHVQAPTIARATVFSLRAAGALDALRLAVPVRASVRVDASQASARATAIAFRRADGTTTVATVTQGNMAWGQDPVPLVSGRCEVIGVPDDAVLAVLLDGARELGRYPIALSAERLNVLRF